ncbi:MAG: ribosomal protein S18-alanine N-acetyltransferase [Chloroflexota bacterium]
MEPRDVPRVAAIDRLSFPTPWPAAAFQRELRRKEATYLVLTSRADCECCPTPDGWLRRLLPGRRSDRVIGYVGYRHEEGEGHITTLAVHPNRRGRHLGDLLLLVALEKISRAGIDRVTLEMRPSNQVAHELYEKHGFRVLKSRRAYYSDGEDAWVMEAAIDNESYEEELAALRDRLDHEVIVQSG